MEDDSQQDQHTQQLLIALWQSVKAIAKEEANSLNKDVSDAFTAALTETLFDQIQTMAIDLEAFASHNSRRAVINMEDVKLCARRNESLYQIISERAKEMAEEATNKRRRN
ncbi:kinetochore component CENP-S-domain-containing protein [Mycotypha africana]|uniref:kinetochore component CENP-S-domain-containing protein n=1 Tax=Mycotypha africana TaxID=64632 RepID=UPI002301F5DF|nr:kinetochore component CENP-S-domain-containing protein [Mycotypha africana]KAI8971557.1 kinetochore component CENP-S-domain-containing protein [Mycotypha africana]